MIQTGNKEIDALVNMLQAQRNEAQDAVAIIASKLKVQETLVADLQKQLEAAKPKEGEQ